MLSPEGNFPFDLPLSINIVHRIVRFSEKCVVVVRYDLNSKKKYSFL